MRNCKYFFSIAPPISMTTLKKKKKLKLQLVHLDRRHLPCTLNHLQSLPRLSLQLYILTATCNRYPRLKRRWI